MLPLCGRQPQPVWKIPKISKNVSTTPFWNFIFTATVMTLGMKDAPQICPAPSSIGNVSAEDSAGQNASWGLSIAWPENINAEELCIRSDGAGTNVMYRWNHAFSIPVTAPRESDTPQE